jgi:hypothetical protein
MAIALIMDFEGGTLDQYDQVLEKMELGDKLAPGGIFHWVAETDDGFRVVDVWESQDAYEKFAEEKIGPLTAEAGLSEPKITPHELHNTMSG